MLERGLELIDDGSDLRGCRLQSASPKAAGVRFADNLHAIDDPEFVAIYREYDAAFEARRWAHKREAAAAADPGIAQLIATSTGSSSLAWDRLKEIAKERGATTPGSK